MMKDPDDTDIDPDGFFELAEDEVRRVTYFLETGQVELAQVAALMAIANAIIGYGLMQLERNKGQ